MDARILGRGWGSVPMVNNVARRRPFGHDAHSAAVEAARQARVPTALDEGRAWRRRKGGVLAVLRVEAFADDAPSAAAAHRAAWTVHAEPCLDATWRDRWAEREVTPGWVEARWVRPDVRPDPLHVFGAAEAPPGPAADIDWVRVEDHTGDGLEVTTYHHVTVWVGRFQAVLTVRHGLGLDLEPSVVGAAVHLHGALPR